MRFTSSALLSLTVIGLLAAAPAHAQSIPNNVLHSSPAPTDEALAIETEPANIASAPAQTLDQAVEALQTQMAALLADNERMHHLLLQQNAELAIHRGTTRASLQALATRVNNLSLPEGYRAASRPTTAQPQLRSSLAAK